jgi:hypothetical protein
MMVLIWFIDSAPTGRESVQQVLQDWRRGVTRFLGETSPNTSRRRHADRLPARSFGEHFCQAIGGPESEPITVTVAEVKAAEDVE